ncbi:hypothetical protein TNCV_4675561 [Trichonephila clavipes]|nr:hypothetical protein TNCV_4675561 [Trichonephila clavipes]
MLPDYTFSSCQWSHQVPLILSDQKDLLHLGKVSTSPGISRTHNALFESHKQRYLHGSPSCARHFESQRFT